MIGCWWWLAHSSSKHSGRCQQVGPQYSAHHSLSGAELTFAAQTSSQHTGERPERERRVSDAAGHATTYYVLGRMPFIMHAAVTVISVLSATIMYSLQWTDREREGCPAHEQTGAVFGSLCTHTHSTPLHSSPLCSSYASLWVRPHWSCMLACWGPHYDHLSSCKHCN